MGYRSGSGRRAEDLRSLAELFAILKAERKALQNGPMADSESHGASHTENRFRASLGDGLKTVLAKTASEQNVYS